MIDGACSELVSDSGLDFGTMNNMSDPANVRVRINPKVIAKTTGLRIVDEIIDGYNILSLFVGYTA
jgi:hypothetical protein